MILHACLFALALQTPSTPASSGERLVVTHEGAFLSPESVIVRGNTPAPMQSAGTIWSHVDGGLAWVGNALSIGNHGSEVLAEYDMNSERAELFSVFDTNPPTALWSDLAVLGSEFHHVASAEGSNVHVVLHTLNRGLPNASYRLSKYTSLSGGTPDWTYTFPISYPIADDYSNVGISRDGRRIVAAASNPASSSVSIAVFNPASNVPVSYTTVPLGGLNNRLRGFDLSADGSTLYFSAAGIPVQGYVFDVATHAVVFSTPLDASFDGHAISGDGSVFAYGSFGTLRLFEKVAGVYTNTYTRYLPGSNFCNAIDISDDGSTLACGWSFDDFYLTTRIEALDIPTHNLTMGEVVSATGVLQNIVSEVSISADGERFAVGLWGDGTGPVAEARLYSKRFDAPLVTLDLDGSVYGVKISADGQRAVFGSKQMHANQFGNGGRIDLVGGSTPFDNFCFGDGSLATACPCANSGLLGRGCDNSGATGGALLTASGRVVPDSVVLTSSNELAHAPSIFLQGTSESTGAIVFGDGLRCVSGTLKRLYTKPAVDGTVVAPAAGEPSITARSAALGDPLAPGQTRRYQVYYRDPQVGFCPGPGGDTWNISNAVRVAW
jgi:hypothetical protein